LKRVAAVCFDLSGTIHIGDAVVGDAVSKLAHLRKSLPDVPILLLSNTSKVSKLTLAAQLRRLGVEDAAGQPLESIMMTSISACAACLDPATSHPLLLTTDDAATEFSGFVSATLAEDAGTHAADSAATCSDVVVALAPHRMHYHSIDRAFRVLKQASTPPARLIAAHKGVYQRDSDGRLHLGPGPFVAALEQAAGVKAEVVGKPSRAFLGSAQELLEAAAGRSLALDEIAMVGDDARDDAGGAAAFGWTGVLVRTGKFSTGDEQLARAASCGTGRLLVVKDCGAFVDALIASKAGEPPEAADCRLVE
jgi:HAD superfamily hydrolase (TIGR01458 family)